MNRACFINLSAVDPMATEIAEALKVLMWEHEPSHGLAQGLAMWMCSPLERNPKAERKGRSAEEVGTSEARKIGESLAQRGGSSPSDVCLPY